MNWVDEHCCKSCKFNIYSIEEGEYICSCKDSEAYSLPVNYDDTCEEHVFLD